MKKAAFFVNLKMMSIKRIIIALIVIGVLYVVRIFLLKIPFLGWGYEAFEIETSIFLFNLIMNPISIVVLVSIIGLVYVIILKKTVVRKHIYIQFIIYVILLFWIYQGFRIEKLFSLGIKITISIERIFANDNVLPRSLNDITMHNFDENEVTQVTENFKYELEFAQPIPMYGYSLELQPTFIEHHRFVCKPWTKEFIMFD